jgi:hypothetical protein
MAQRDSLRPGLRVDSKAFEDGETRTPTGDTTMFSEPDRSCELQETPANWYVSYCSGIGKAKRVPLEVVSRFGGGL